jgi:hypothetical protein
MMMLQKYQFEQRDCSHISCHNEAGIWLAKKYKSFKFTVATDSWLHLSPVANLGHWQGGLVTIATGAGQITKTVATEIRIATGDRRHSTVATETGPACYWPIIAMKSSKFSPTSLSEMKTYDVKNSYCPRSTRVNRGREKFVNSFKIYRSWQNLILYGHSLQIFFCRSINVNIGIVHISQVINL